MDVKFTDLSEGQNVEFEVEKSEKGPRAINVRVIAATV
ncbi:MAG: cold shock domain-containing protein [Candidatus Omnitrophica bacterium]|nr:cold shock domain-containing protein [Candidatus Omnitrophota bacterium]